MKWHYRILRYGDNGYKVQYSRDWTLFGGKHRGFWHNLKESGEQYSWVAEFDAVEDAKKAIEENKVIDRNHTIGWKVVCEV